MRPKALCPVGNVPLVDRALARLRPLGVDLAVNVHHRREQLESHLEHHEARPHVSVEASEALGTAGALAHLRDWLDGRAAVVVNADSVSAPDLSDFLQAWDGERVLVLLAGGGPLAPTSRLVASVVPWSWVSQLAPEPTGLYEHVFGPASDAGQLDVAGYDGLFVDCGTPAEYLRANLLVSGGDSVVGEGATIAGTIDECVVWAGVEVRAAEILRRSIRVDRRMTVSVR